MNKRVLQAILFVSLLSLFNSSCKKDLKPEGDSFKGNKESTAGPSGHLKQTKTFSSDLVVSWINKQLDMFRAPLPPGTQAAAQERVQAYCGIALYEAVVPGMPSYQSLSGQLTGLPAMPLTEPGKAYHWAASANAALADMNRKLFPLTAQVNKDAITHLKDSLKAVYATEVDAFTLDRSIAFGKAVATKVYDWALTDGFSNSNPPYVPPVGPGLWVPTAILPSPPNPPGTPAPAVNPYAFQRRLLVPGVANGTTPAPLPTFSTTPGSEFWNMAMDTYNKRNNSTLDQEDAVRYAWDPGYGPGGGFISILSQTISKANPLLDVAALAYAKVGIAQIDATILCFVNKYNFNVIRPITYINLYIDLEHDWTTQIPTPNHPEFPSGHATINSAVFDMFTNVFGENFQLTLHTYDYLGYPSRPYDSFEEMSIELSDSRVWAGLHYQVTQDKSRVMGKKVAANVLTTIKFKKD